MDPVLSFIEFQTQKLDYNFRNIDLLQEALTHTGDNQRTFHERLLPIGVDVLKFIVSYHFVRVSSALAGPGSLTNKKDALIKNDNLLIVFANKLLSKDDVPLHYLRTKEPKNATMERSRVPTDCLKAILAAVYLDSGSIPHDEQKSISKCEELFMNLWCPGERPLSEGVTLQSSFPVSEEVRKLWFQSQESDELAKQCEDKLRIKFVNRDLLSEATTHPSFYDPVRNDSKFVSLHLPDFQRLEFLGDAVLGLVVSEFLFYTNPKFRHLGDPNLSGRELFSYLVSASFLEDIVDKYGLERYLKRKPARDWNWTGHDQVVEAIIGALYVDGGFAKASRFIRREWDFTYCTTFAVLECRPPGGVIQIPPAPFLENTLEGKLGHCFNQGQLLISALSHASSRTENHENYLRGLEMETLGKYLIQLRANDYVTRSVKAAVSKGSLESRRNYLCGGNVLKEIAGYLNLRHHVQMPPNLKHGKKPFDHYEKFVRRIFAAIFLDKKDTHSSKIPATEEIFYRLWNRYLNQCPTESLIDAFPPSTISHQLLRSKLGFQSIPKEIEKNLKYTFKQRHLLEQALTDRKSRYYSTDSTVGDSTRFQILGEAVLNAFLTIDSTVGSSSRNEIIEKLNMSPGKLREIFLEMFPCNCTLTRQYYVVPPRQKQVSDKEIGLSLLGAMFVDSSMSYVAKLAFSTSFYSHLDWILEVLKENLDQKRLQDEKQKKIQDENDARLAQIQIQLELEESEKKCIKLSSKIKPTTTVPSTAIASSSSSESSNFQRKTAPTRQLHFVGESSSPYLSSSRAQNDDSSFHSGTSKSSKPTAVDSYLQRASVNNSLWFKQDPPVVMQSSRSSAAGNENSSTKNQPAAAAAPRPSSRYYGAPSTSQSPLGYYPYRTPSPVKTELVAAREPSTSTSFRSTHHLSSDSARPLTRSISPNTARIYENADRATAWDPMDPYDQTDKIVRDYPGRNGTYPLSVNEQQVTYRGPVDNNTKPRSSRDIQTQPFSEVSRMSESSRRNESRNEPEPVPMQNIQVRKAIACLGTFVAFVSFVAGLTFLIFT